MLSFTFFTLASCYRIFAPVFAIHDRFLLLNGSSLESLTVLCSQSAWRFDESETNALDFSG